MSDIHFLVLSFPQAVDPVFQAKMLDMLKQTGRWAANEAQFYPKKWPDLQAGNGGWLVPLSPWLRVLVLRHGPHLEHVSLGQMLHVVQDGPGHQHPAKLRAVEPQGSGCGGGSHPVREG